MMFQPSRHKVAPTRRVLTEQRKDLVADTSYKRPLTHHRSLQETEKKERVVSTSENS